MIPCLLLLKSALLIAVSQTWLFPTACELNFDYCLVQIHDLQKSSRPPRYFCSRSNYQYRALGTPCSRRLQW